MIFVKIVQTKFHSFFLQVKLYFLQNKITKRPNPQTVNYKLFQNNPFGLNKQSPNIRKAKFVLLSNKMKIYSDAIKLYSDNEKI